MPFLNGEVDWKSIKNCNMGMCQLQVSVYNKIMKIKVKASKT